MASAPDLDLLTIPEVAKLLKVSEVTIARWLKDGRLPAYRIGPRAVRVRRSDLAGFMTPLQSEPAPPDAEGRHRAEWDHLFEPLTDEEVRQRLQWLEEAKELGDRILARRGGKPFSDSAELIRREREKRSRQL